jgi:hypothetical protein
MLCYCIYPIGIIFFCFVIPRQFSQDRYIYMNLATVIHIFDCNKFKSLCFLNRSKVCVVHVLRLGKFVIAVAVLKCL